MFFQFLEKKKLFILTSFCRSRRSSRAAGVWVDSGEGDGDDGGDDDEESESFIMTRQRHSANRLSPATCLFIFLKNVLEITFGNILSYFYYHLFLPAMNHTLQSVWEDWHDLSLGNIKITSILVS